ncbi:heterokaryon incompatibility protein domain-containing protein [Trichoderma novae-zelandiae]
MRLIDTSTLKLEEFSDDSIPPYAILSHTWGNDSEELTFRQVENGEIDKQNLGSTKLRGCCEQARRDGLGYAWIDTCCIDKTNLVELSEAINSMYRWYRRAAICYAYLSDVPDDDDPPRQGSKFRSSRWFQRGWTLQELLAPKHLRFYNSNWRSIGTKGTICSVLKNITGVPQQFLLGITSLHGASIAQRMSWAAQRQTKRAEDVAYCLLGLFKVTMPMIYGEGGEQAFFRLQEQIMKTTRDDSILAWGLSDGASKPSMNDKGQVIGGEVLAVAPSSFTNSAQIVAREHTPSSLHSLDVFGGSVRVHLPLLVTPGGATYGILGCGPASDRQMVVGIPLAKASSGGSNEYIRPFGCPSVLQPINAAGSPPELIHIKRDGRRDASAATKQQYWICEDDLFARVNLALVDVEPPSCWDEQMNLISALHLDDAAADRILLRFRHGEGGSQDFVMVLDVTPPALNDDPRFYVVTCSRDTPLLELVERHEDISSKASGKTSASNGTLHLRITLEPVEEGLISINPHPMDKPPDFTIDVSAELEKLNLVTEFVQLLKDKRQEKEEEEKLQARLILGENRLHRAEKEREAVEDQIKQLEETRRKLVVEEDDSIREVQILEQEQGVVKERQGDILKQLSHALERLDKPQLSDDAEAGSTLIREAETHGDAEAFRLFDNRVDGLMMTKYGTLLIAASSRGDVESVRQILATSGCEIDREDSRYGRAALGCASANGHGAVVQLLLDTGKVDVGSTDNTGWSPLRWASERYHKMIRLLISGGARMSCQLIIQCQTKIILIVIVIITIIIYSILYSLANVFIILGLL